MKKNYFLQEILHGKNIKRAQLFAALKALFAEKPYLNSKSIVLELGGESASHQRAYPPLWNIQIADLKPGPKVMYVFDANGKFPLKNDEVDAVVFFNTLPMIRDYMNCLQESLRISKKFIIFNIPLISNLTPHPQDFTRMTEDRIHEVIDVLKTTIPLTQCTIIPIGHSFSSAVSLLDPYFKWRIIKVPLFLLAVWFDRFDRGIGYRCPHQYLILLEK